MLDSFNIRVEFAPDGKVEHAYYWDQDGCGHERAFGLSTDLSNLIQYHLGHMDKSHGLQPPRRCTYVLATVDQGRLHCTLEPHGSETNHRFEVGF